MSNEHTHSEYGDPEGDGYIVHAHITPLKTNFIVIGALFMLTGLTIAAYYVRLGEWNLAVALLIASVKATLVGTWFMHLKYEKAFNTSFFVGTILFMSIFFGYTANDTLYRGQVNGIHGAYVDTRSGESAPGSATGGSPTGIVPIPALPEGHGEAHAEGEAADAGEHGEHGEAEEADAPAEAAPAEEAEGDGAAAE